MATEYIERKVGDTYPVVIAIATDSGAAHDMTGATNVLLGIDADKANTSPDDAEILVLGSVSDPSAGEVTFDADATDSVAAMAVGNYWAEVQFIQSSYKRTTKTFPFRIIGQIITS